jgi:hypothetical protein
LAVLGGHRDIRSLRVLADAARSIRDGFEGLGLQNKAMIVGWYHLKKRCEPCLSRAGRAAAGTTAVRSKPGPGGVVAWSCGGSDRGVTRAGD